MLKQNIYIKVTYFPFDDQVCSLKFGSWTYSGTQVDLINRSTSVDLSNYVESGEWNLKSITLQRNIKHYPCCPDESFPDITFDLALRRKTTFYLINIILPMIWLSFLSLLVFCIPPESGMFCQFWVIFYKNKEPRRQKTKRQNYKKNLSTKIRNGTYFVENRYFRYQSNIFSINNIIRNTKTHNNHLIFFAIIK